MTWAIEEFGYPTPTRDDAWWLIAEIGAYIQAPEREARLMAAAPELRAIAEEAIAALSAECECRDGRCRPCENAAKLRARLQEVTRG